MDNLQYEIDPPLLTPWMGEHWRERNILWCDFQIDVTKNNEIRFDFDIAFNRISDRRGKVNRRDYYIGCTGAEIKVEFKNSEIIRFTKSAPIQANYSASETINRNSSVVFQPSLKAKSTEFKIGALQYEQNKEVTFSTSFQGSERILDSTKHKYGVVWEIALPRGKKIVRDYMMGNLHLFTSVKCTDKYNEGKIKVKPSDVLFFGPNKAPLGFRKSALMKFYLNYKGIDVYNEDGIEMSFKKTILE